MSRFDALQDYLADLDTDEVTLAFSAIERLIGLKLTDAVRTRPQTWANSKKTSTRGWQGAGFVAKPNFATGTVTFRRGTGAFRSTAPKKAAPLGTGCPHWSPLRSLSTRRPVFHSEADFQFELAWELAGAGWTAIRLERPYRLASHAQYLDLLATDPAGIRWGIELKYWTSDLLGTWDTEALHLRDQSAHDLNRYAFCKDIVRLETLLDQSHIDRGRVVAVTNDAAYLRPPTRATIDAAFKLHGGHTLRGRLNWTKPTATTKGKPALQLKGSYELSWSAYSFNSAFSNGGFAALDVVLDGSE